MGRIDKVYQAFLNADGLVSLLSSSGFMYRFQAIILIRIIVYLAYEKVLSSERNHFDV
jgi:hypothetical protein